MLKYWVEVADLGSFQQGFELSRSVCTLNIAHGSLREVGECSVEEWAVGKSGFFPLGHLYLPLAAFVSCL